MYFYSLIEQTDIAKVGGKGYNLGCLHVLAEQNEALHNDILIPETLIFSADFYRDQVTPLLVRHTDKLASLEHDHEIEMFSNMFMAELNQLSIDADSQEQLNDWLQLFPDDARFAIRSSSTMEDLAEAAFAGQHDSFLNVGKEQIWANIIRCLQSLWNPHAIRYRMHHGFDHRDAAMAVVVQQMIQAQSSGVAFAVNPINGNLQESLVEASFGLGEAVVGGEALTDHWRVQFGQQASIVHAHIAEKNHIVVATEQGTEQQQLAPETAILPSLKDHQVIAIATLARTLMQQLQAPQDIEWVIAHDQLYLVQTRPQTTLPPRFTRDESAERFPDPLTPLTWSCVSCAFNESLEYSLRLMNVTLPTRPWFELKDGYVYGNQNAVELLAMKRPIAAQNAEQLLEEVPLLFNRYQWLLELPRQWMTNLDQFLISIGKLQQCDLSHASMAEWQQYFSQLMSVSTAYFRPNIAISMTQAFLTKSLYQIIYMIVGDDEEARALFHAITASADTKTAQINRQMHQLAQHLTEVYDSHPALSQPATLVELFNCAPDFQQALQQFLDCYGHRENSFDYYHPTWADAPNTVLDLLHNLQHHQFDHRGHSRIKHQQITATQTLFNHVPEAFHFFLSELIHYTQNFTYLDDLEHFQTSRINQLVRRSVEQFGKRLGLNEPMDLFFLTLEEIRLLEQWQLPMHYRQLMQQRKEQFVAATQREPDWLYGVTSAPVQVSDNMLQGIPGSRGVKRGQVYLVRSPADFAGMPTGAILVAKTTNPAWTPLFYRAAAIITESGGPLSHGAVTAREIGIPAVMAVREVFNQLSHEQWVEVDGLNGTVTLLSEQQNQSSDEHSTD